MGGIIGGVVGAAGSLLGGQSAKKNALTGYRYLTGASGDIPGGIQGTVKAGNAATDATSQLLGTEPMKAGTQSGYNNYLNSTGYNFQRTQGSQAITGNAASRGLLNSGATGKALTQYGQNIGGSYFNNYLTQLGDQANRGLQASGQIASAGTQGGVEAGKAMQSGITKASGIGAGSASNFFGSF